MRRDSQMRTRFAKDTAGFKMTIAVDDDLYRHVRFRPTDGTSMYWFDLHTSPGVLMVRGDMGTYVFSRVDDMFAFFRGERINPVYWAEKLVADSGVRRYDAAKVSAMVKAEFDGVKADYSPQERRVLWECLERDVLSHVDDEHRTKEALFGFISYDSPRFELYIESEDEITDYTAQFLWSLWAIVRGIRKYDAEKARRAARAAKRAAALEAVAS